MSDSEKRSMKDLWSDPPNAKREASMMEPDSQRDAPPEWEMIEDHGRGETSRLRIGSGWLYRVIEERVSDTSVGEVTSVAVAVTFVPD